MKLQERIDVLTKLGVHLQEEDEFLNAIMQRTQFNNQWFTVENQEKAIQNIANYFLDEGALKEWLGKYAIPDQTNAKTLGLVMAGNIPLVGFHDILSVFVSGHKAKIKLSEKDAFLLPYLIKLLARFDERASEYFQIVPFLKDFDAVIATGSNNSARYFDAYFGKYPNIIRKNRNAVAVLTGEETADELSAFGLDVFQYFGLGCRNVSKIYVPKDYHFDRLLESLHQYKEIILNTKYKNNFDYNYSLHILNKVAHLNNGCIILLEAPEIQSRIANLHYEFYEETEKLEQELDNREEEIQCIVARSDTLQKTTIAFGQTQEPRLWDYADGVDTLEFLLKL